MLILDGHDVRALLDIDALIEAVAVAHGDLSAGRVSMPDRTGAFLDASTGLLDMPVYVPSIPALVSKLVTIFPTNAGTPRPVRQAVIVAFDPASGEPAALIEATYLTAARTAAASALSARLLARPEAATLAVLGTGPQAREHARTLPRVRPISTVHIAGRDPVKARALAAELSDELAADVTAVEDFRAAIEDADIVCGTTYATEPVIRREWLSPGTHITSVGYNPSGRELDDATVVAASLFVESRHAALNAVPPNLDLAEPLARGLITAADVRGELGELVNGTVAGRTDQRELTLYKSVGVAVQDAAAATLVLAASRAQHPPA